MTSGHTTLGGISREDGSKIIKDMIDKYARTLTDPLRSGVFLNYFGASVDGRPILTIEALTKSLDQRSTSTITKALKETKAGFIKFFYENGYHLEDFVDLWHP